MISALQWILEALIMPPLSLFLVAGVGFALIRRRPRLARWLLGGAGAVAFLLSTPLVASTLLRSLQTYAALDPADSAHEAGAIVVLAAGSLAHSPEYGHATVGPLTLQRLRYAAFLARRHELPLLVSGGRAKPDHRPYGEMMKEVLEGELGVPVRWAENNSANTRQNASMSADILAKEGIERIFLVTHAWHMPRAKAQFVAAGLTVVPAPTAFRSEPDYDLRTFLPSSRAFHESTWAVHEWVGRAWYWMVGLV